MKGPVVFFPVGNRSIFEQTMSYFESNVAVMTLEWKHSSYIMVKFRGEAWGAWANDFRFFFFFNLFIQTYGEKPQDWDAKSVQASKPWPRLALMPKV